MKKLKIIITITLLTICLLQLVPTICKADDLKINPDDYKLDEISGYEETIKKAQGVVNVLQAAGTVIAVGGIMALGVKYMMGSVEERASYKKTMMPYLIGCIMLLTITTIVKIVYDLVDTFNKY